MDLDLRNKTALVCGASQGLGAAIAEALAHEGCKVGLLARNAAKLEGHVRSFGAHGLEAQALPADMGDWASVDAALKCLIEPQCKVIRQTRCKVIQGTKDESNVPRACAILGYVSLP